MKYKGLDRGFTLIELLVVISIIGLLSSVVLASLSTARASARDSERIAAVKQIQNALELYALDHGGEYPGYINPNTTNGESAFARSVAGSQEIGTGNSGCGYGSPGASGDGNTTYMPGIWCRLENALSPYIKKLPRTFISNNTYYYFVYKVPARDTTTNPKGIKFYGLSTRLERPNSISQNDGGSSSIDFEVGQLPRYCASLVDPPLPASPIGKDWSSWSSTPCSCLVPSDYNIGGPSCGL